MERKTPRRIRFGIATLVAVATLAGCGGHKQSDLDKATMDAELASLNLRIAQDALNNGGDLPAATDAYVAFIRLHKDDLGHDRAARLLADRASEVEPYCVQCADELDRARDTL